MALPNRQLNVRLVGALLAAIVVVMIGIAVVHNMQIARNAGGLARLARAKVAEGRQSEAITLFTRYLFYRPDDATVQAELARLLIEYAERPTATRNDRGYAYNVLERAVRKNPDDAILRKRLIEWMLRYGRYGDAAKELVALRERSSADAGEEPPFETDEIALLQARALVGQGQFRDAAAVAAGIIGFDMTDRTFVEDPLTAGIEPAATAPGNRRPEHDAVVQQASFILASILDERLSDPDSAAAVLEHLVVSNPSDPQAWLLLARWHQSRKQLAKAAEAVRKAAELAPDNPDVMYTDIELCLAENRYDVAERLALKARELFPEDESAFRALASVAIRKGDTDKAIAVLRQGLEEQPDQPSLLLMLADIQLQDNRLAEAEQTLKTFAQNQGDTIPAAGLLQARLLIAQKRWLPARQKLDSVRPLVAESAALTRQIDLLLGQCHEMLGQFDEQLAANQRVLSEDYDSLAARTGVAAALAAAGKPDEALAEYETVAATLPPDRLAAVRQVWAPLLQLRIAREMKRPTAERDWTAVDRLLDTLEQSPLVTASELAVLRADMLVRQGDKRAAETLLREAVQVDPSNPRPLAALVMLVMREQGPTEAASLMERVPAPLADDPLLLIVQAQLAARTPAEQSAAALTAVVKKAAALPTDQAVQVLTSIAAIYRTAGDRKLAEETLLAASTKRPDDLSIRASLFELACEQADVEKAEAAAADLARLAGPTSPQGRAAAAAALILGVRIRQAEAVAALGHRDREVDATSLSPEDNAKLTEARNLLIEAENDRPGWSQIQQLFAEIAILQRDLPTAIERLQQAIRMGPANPAVIRSLVSLLFLSNRLDEAQQTLDTVGPEGLVGLERVSAEIDLKMGQFDDAVALAERSLANNRNLSVGDLLWFGQLLARAGKTERAQEVLQRAVDADPGQPGGWMALFATQLAAGRRQPALKTLAEAGERLSPPQRQLVLAQGQEMLGQADEAERNFRAAVAAAPDDPGALRSLAAFLVRRGRLASAREELRAIIALPGSDPGVTRARVWARRTLAEIMAQGGGYRESEQALALIDENVDANGRLAAEDLSIQFAILARRPEPDSWRKALVILERLSSLQPLASGQRMQRAQLLEQLGRWDEARDQLLSIASAPGTPPLVISLLIERLVQHRELGAARIWLKSLSNRIPKSPLVAALEAKLALAENDRTTAVSAVRKLMPGDAPAPELAGHLGPLADLLEGLGFTTAAEQVFSQFAASSSDGLVAKAEFLGRNKRGDEALELLDASWDKIPLETLLRTGVSVLRSLGISRTKQQTETVGRWFAKARRQDPESVSLVLLQADFLVATGTEAEATKTYRELHARNDISPLQSAVVANNLAYQLAEPGTVDEAVALVDTAFPQLGPHPDLLDTRGVVMLEAGRVEQAVADLEEAVLVPTAAKYLHLALALALGQQIDKARDALAKAQEIGFREEGMSVGDRRRLGRLKELLDQ